MTGAGIENGIIIVKVLSDNYIVLWRRTQVKQAIITPCTGVGVELESLLTFLATPRFFVRMSKKGF